MLASVAPGSRPGERPRNHTPTPCAARSLSRGAPITRLRAILASTISTPQKDRWPVFFRALVRPVTSPLVHPAPQGPQTSQEEDRSFSAARPPRLNVLASTIPMHPNPLTSITSLPRHVLKLLAQKRTGDPSSSTARPPRLNVLTPQEDRGRSSSVVWCFASTRPQSSQEEDRGPVLFTRPPRPNVLASTISIHPQQDRGAGPLHCLGALSEREVTRGPGAGPLQHPAPQPAHAHHKASHDASSN